MCILRINGFLLLDNSNFVDMILSWLISVKRTNSMKNTIYNIVIHIHCSQRLEPHEINLSLLLLNSKFADSFNLTRSLIDLYFITKVKKRILRRQVQFRNVSLLFKSHRNKDNIRPHRYTWLNQGSSRIWSVNQKWELYSYWES